MSKVINIPKYRKIIGKYVLMEDVLYYSERYNKHVSIKEGYISDGATGAIDIPSLGWWIHDVLCESYMWDDGTECTRKQGSQVLSDILKAEGRWARAWYWKYATYLPWKLRLIKR